jgi:hypothetical protein
MGGHLQVAVEVVSEDGREQEDLVACEDHLAVTPLPFS